MRKCHTSGEYELPIEIVIHFVGQSTVCLALGMPNAWASGTRCSTWAWNYATNEDSKFFIWIHIFSDFYCREKRTNAMASDYTKISTFLLSARPTNVYFNDIVADDVGDGHNNDTHARVRLFSCVYICPHSSIVCFVVSCKADRMGRNNGNRTQFTRWVIWIKCVDIDLFSTWLEPRTKEGEAKWDMELNFQSELNRNNWEQS